MRNSLFALLTVLLVAAVPSSGQTMFHDADASLRASRDDVKVGASQQLTTTSVEQAIIEYKREDGSVYRSYNGGKTWTIKSKSANYEAWEPAIKHKVESFLLYTKIDGSRRISRDGGATWESFGSGSSASRNNSQLAQPAPDDIDKVISAGTFGKATIIKIFPQPSRNYTIIHYHVSDPTSVHIAIHALQGTEILPLVNSEQTAVGDHRIAVDTRSIEPGIYYVRLTAEGSVSYRKILIGY